MTDPKETPETPGPPEGTDGKAADEQTTDEQTADVRPTGGLGPPREPTPVSPETALARTLTFGLVTVFLVAWWHAWDWSALWMVAAAAVFLGGELTPHVFRSLLPLWWVISPILRPIVQGLLAVWRAVVPERYRVYRAPEKPMSMKELFEEINKAIDKEEERKKREGREP
jgi:hypothetical protein